MLDIAALEVHEEAAFVGLGAVLQTEIAAYLFDARFDFLDVIFGMVAFADNDVEMGFSTPASGFDALF